MREALLLVFMKGGHRVQQFHCCRKLIAAPLLVAVVGLNFYPTPAVRADATSLLDTIKKAGVIRIGVALDPPFTLQKKNGQWYSFVPTIDNMLAKSLGVKVRFVPTTWTVIVAGLQANKYDMIGTSIYDTPEREKAISFSVPYAYGGTTYVGLKSTVTKLKTVKALNDTSVSIAVTTASAEDYVTRRLFPKARLKAFPNVTTAFLLQEIFSRHETLFGTASFVLPGLRLKFNNIGFLPDNNRGIDAKGICLGLRKGD